MGEGTEREEERETVVACIPVHHVGVQCPQRMDKGWLRRVQLWRRAVTGEWDRGLLRSWSPPATGSLCIWQDKSSSSLDFPVSWNSKELRTLYLLEQQLSFWGYKF